MCKHIEITDECRLCHKVTYTWTLSDFCSKFDINSGDCPQGIVFEQTKQLVLCPDCEVLDLTQSFAKLK